MPCQYAYSNELLKKRRGTSPLLSAALMYGGNEGELYLRDNRMQACIRPEFKIPFWKLKFLMQRRREFTPGARGGRKASRGVSVGDAD